MQLIRRVARADPLIVDGVFAVALAMIAEIEVWSGGSGSPTLRGIVAVLMTLPLVFRRRVPLPVLGVVMGAALAQSVADPDADVAGVLVVAIIAAAYSVAAHGGRRVTALGGAVGLAALWASVHLQGGGVGNYLFAGAIFGGAWLAGFVLRARHLRAEELEHRTEVLEQEQETRARAAVAEERARIARDLHDAVAHSMSVIVVQAGAERLALPEEATSTREVLQSIEETGRQALVEMRREQRVSTRVLVADDQPLVRVGLTKILEARPDFEVVGEAADGAQAVEATRRLRPDVVLMDIRMPLMDGLERHAALSRKTGRRRACSC